MRIFPDLPLRHRLTLISVVTSAVALLFTGTGIIVYERRAFKQELLHEVAVTAEMIAYNSASSLSFLDPASAGGTLGGLSLHPHIEAACIYDKDGRVFAVYPLGSDPAKFGARPPGAGERFGSNFLELFRPIYLTGENMGTIYLRSDLRELRERLWRYAEIIAGVMLLATAVAFVIAQRLQRVISGPVAELAAIAGQVGTNMNYSVRAVTNSNDELGRLIEGFNGMLGQIEARDTALRQAHDRLEKRVEERTAELAREQARFKFIFESVPVGIALYSKRDGGPESRLINDAQLRICGITREQLDDPAIFQRLSHPDDYARQEAFHRQIEAREIDRFSIEKRYLRPDGRTAWVVFSSQHQWFADGTHEALSTVADITELKQAQEDIAGERARFKFIFDSVPVGISLVAVGKVNSYLVNPAHERMTGISAKNTSIPGVFGTVTHPDDYRCQQELMQPFLRREVEQYTVEKRYLHPGDRVVWVVLTSRRFVDPASGEEKSITTLVDITERKRAEAELAFTHQQLIATSRLAGMAEVAASVLHNVGNVLNSVNVSATMIFEHVRHSKTAMVGKVATLLQTNEVSLVSFLTTDARGRQIPSYLVTLASQLADEQKVVLAEIDGLRANIEHIKSIVAMQQSYAKVCGVAETVGVVDLVEDALRMNAGALSEHEVVLVREFQVQATITIEKHKVLQVLVNLIRNAKHACDDGGPPEKRITVRTTGGADWIEIAVIDNGVGIPSENLTRIFNHGFTTRKNGHGFGLHSGVLAAREIGGELTVHSDGPGQGATFTLRLPTNLPHGGI